MKERSTIFWLGILFLAIGIVVGSILKNAETNPEPKDEKLRLEIQHLKYQVGIDSLRYDLELNFYEKRKEEK